MSLVKKMSLLAVLTLLALTVGTFGFAGADPAQPQGPTTVPVRPSNPLSFVNPGEPFTTVGRNVNITRKVGAQSETTIAVDPTNPNHVLAASNDLAATATIYESTDAGRTWVDAGLGLGSTFCYDPWLDFNAAGDAFFAYECSDQRIAYRQVGQVSWTKTRLSNAGSFPDRDMVVVDTGSGSPFFNSVYIGYDDAGANNAAYLLYSRDGFGNWVRTPKINDTSSTIGVNAAVASDGTVYAVWEDFNGRKIWADRSTDGGLTWSTDHVVTNYRLNTGQFFISIPPQPDRGIVPMAFSDVAPAGTAFAGRLYVTYTDKDPTTADTNVYVRYSTDGGATWSGETMVNDDTVHAYQFHPAISVAPNGTVGVSFYDTRDDQPLNHKTNQYSSFSTDGGVTWSANTKVTTGQSDESGAGDPNDYGDYQGLDAAPTSFFFQVWTDSRQPGTRNEDMVAARWRP